MTTARDASADTALVARIRAGDERAFEAVYARYRDPLFSFCRGMLGSPHDAQDATQQVFANAYRALTESDKPIELKPWLYAIARNHCLSILRQPRPEPTEVEDARSRPGTDLQAEGREYMRDLLGDVSGLPKRQRAAVVMATLGGFSHAEIATAIGCETEQVKATLFQARTALSEHAQAREASCAEIRDQLRVLRGGSLRRNKIRLHLKHCEGCREYRQAIRRERLATGAGGAAPLAWHPVTVGKSLLAKLGIAGAGLREQGAAQLAAAVLAAGVGVLGVATVAPEIHASPSPPAVTSSVPRVGSATASPSRSAAHAPAATPEAAQPAESPPRAKGDDAITELLALLGMDGLDLSKLLGRDGGAIGTLDLVPATAASSTQRAREASGDWGGSRVGSPSDPDTGDRDESTPDRCRRLLSRC